jgi:hypothetical protein
MPSDHTPRIVLIAFAMIDLGARCYLTLFGVPFFILFFHVANQMKCKHGDQEIRRKLIDKMFGQWLFGLILTHI